MAAHHGDGSELNVDGEGTAVAVVPEAHIDSGNIDSDSDSVCDDGYGKRERYGWGAWQW